MSTLDSHLQLESSAEAVMRARNTFRVTLVMLPALLLTMAVYFYLAFQKPAWQLAAAGGFVSAYFAACLVGLALNRRGRSTLSAQIVIIGIALGFLGFTVVIQDFGLLLGIVSVMLAVAVGGYTLPPRTFQRTIIAVVALGIANLLLDLFLPPYRLVVPEIQVYVPVVLGLLVIVFGFFAARQFNRYTLRAKLIFALLLISLAPLIGFGFAYDYFARQRLTDSADQMLSTAAARTASAIDTFINTNMENIRAESELPVLAEYLSLPASQRPGSKQEADVMSILRFLSRKDPDNIKSYALLSPEGQDLVDTFIQDIGADESGEDYFIKVSRVGQLYFSPVLLSSADRQPYLYFSGPVRASSGEVIGVLRVRYHAGVLQQLISNNAVLTGQGVIGALLDENHIRLAHSAAPYLNSTTVVPLAPALLAELQAARRLPNWPVSVFATNLPALERGLKNAATQPYFTGELEQTSGTTQGQTGAAGPDMEQAAVATVKTQPWLVVFAQPQSVFLTPLKEQTRNTYLLVLGIAGLVTIVAMGGAQLLTGPLSRFTEAAKRVAAGDLTVQAQVTTQDEIGALAQAFNSMTAQLREMIGGLEQRVAERTRELERRATQIATGAEVARVATAVLDPDQLVTQVVELIRERFDYYYVGLFLVDESNRYAALNQGTGEAGRVMKERGHRLEVGGASMVGWVCANKQARIALDVGQDAVHFANPLLPNTHSEMALPLRIGDRVIGALDAQSTLVSAFDENDIAALQGMTDQIATALENARLFQQTQRTMKELDEASRLMVRQGWQDYLKQSSRSAEFSPAGVSPASFPVEPLALRIPLELRGQTVGTLVMERGGESRPWMEDEVEAIRAIAQQATLTLDNARLFEEAQRTAERERLLNEITARVRAAATLEGVLNSAVREISQVTGANYAAIDLELADSAA